MSPRPLIATALLVCPAVTTAQDITLTPLLDARLRREEVTQAGLPRTADAVTLRVRPGLLARRGDLSMLVEGEATAALIQRYDSGSNGRAPYPLVADPQNAEINRAQIGYRAGPLAATAGRQVIELADQRFVGSASFRQNQRSFDAGRLQLGDPRHLFADVTLAWSQRTTAGVNGRGTRPTAIGGTDLFALAGARTPAGTLTGFAYLVDQDQVASQGHGLSSQTWGVRLTGEAQVAGLKLAYTGSWARQGDYARNPDRYAATYWLAQAIATGGPLALTAGHEVLGASDGRALTSVQTPLASIFGFQGWADKFTTTPPDGIRDLYAGARLGRQRLGPFTAVAVSATWHRFRSDRLSRSYGREWDMLASARRGRTTLSLRYARYEAEGFATDTRKLWLEAGWAL